MYIPNFTYVTHIEMVTTPDGVDILLIQEICPDNIYTTSSPDEIETILEAYEDYVISQD